MQTSKLIPTLPLNFKNLTILEIRKCVADSCKLFFSCYHFPWHTIIALLQLLSHYSWLEDYVAAIISFFLDLNLEHLFNLFALAIVFVLTWLLLVIFLLLPLLPYFISQTSLFQDLVFQVTFVFAQLFIRLLPSITAPCPFSISFSQSSLFFSSYGISLVPPHLLYKNLSTFTQPFLASSVFLFMDLDYNILNTYIYTSLRIILDT